MQLSVEKSKVEWNGVVGARGVLCICCSTTAVSSVSLGRGYTQLANTDNIYCISCTYYV